MHLKKSIILLSVIGVIFLCSSTFAAYIDNGNGSVTDTATNLMWQQATAPGLWTWYQADDYCANLTLAGHSDWRLPTIDELSTLFDKNIPPPGPKINRNYFPDTEVDFPYWSSTPEGRPSLMWFLHFETGPFNLGVMSEQYCVRAVRLNQSGATTTTTNQSTTTTTQPYTSTIESTTTTTQPYTSTIESTTTTTQPYTSTIESTTTTIMAPRGLCPAEKVLGGDNPALYDLRVFRDIVLAKSAIGRKITQIYYNNSESINGVLDRSPAMRAVVRRVIEVIAPILGKKE